MTRRPYRPGMIAATVACLFAISCGRERALAPLDRQLDLSPPLVQARR